MYCQEHKQKKITNSYSNYSTANNYPGTEVNANEHFNLVLNESIFILKRAHSTVTSLDILYPVLLQYMMLNSAKN